MIIDEHFFIDVFPLLNALVNIEELED